MTFCMCVGLYDIKFVYNTRTVETALKHVMPSLVRPSHFDAYKVKCFALV